MFNSLRRIIDLFKGDRSQELSNGDIVVEVPTAYIDIGPFGFHKYAIEYQLAANAITTEQSFSPVPYYLLCRSIELGLKAYLLTRGFSRSDLKKIGHNLSKLLKISKRRGITKYCSFSQHEEEAIRRANVVYKSKAFEYYDLSRILSDFSNLPELDELAIITSNLLASIERECKDYSRSR
jgi:hypothetical protein